MRGIVCSINTTAVQFGGIHQFDGCKGNHRYNQTPWFWKWWHPTACTVPTVLAIIKIPAVTVAVTAIMNNMRAFSITNLVEF